jgi:hypothetical protein
MEAAGLLMDELTALKGKADFHCSNAANGKPVPSKWLWAAIEHPLALLAVLSGLGVFVC